MDMWIGLYRARLWNKVFRVTYDPHHFNTIATFNAIYDGDGKLNKVANREKFQDMYNDDFQEVILR